MQLLTISVILCAHIPQVNALGVLLLFQSTYPLLKKSSSPKFIPISALGGSIAFAAELPLNILPYSVSKAALNFITRKLHFEFPELSESIEVLNIRLFSDVFKSHFPTAPRCSRDRYV